MNLDTTGLSCRVAIYRAVGVDEGRVLMEFRVAPVGFAEIECEIRVHWAGLPSAVDSFLEDHINASTHYRLFAGGEAAGFASIHGETLITQFAVADPFRRYGQELFRLARRTEQVNAAFVPTCDEFFLSHALDDYRELAKQAYFFAAGPEIAAPAGFALRPAASDDIEMVKRESGDFLADADGHIARGELVVTMRGEEPVGFGLAIPSGLYPDVASIGMFTIERHRRSGVGAATIALLIERCRTEGVRPVAGCWYYNHRSKQTLERAGMFGATRLLRIGY
jgi:GNAT superfamily N-acetyltransferase